MDIVRRAWSLPRRGAPRQIHRAPGPAAGFGLAALAVAGETRDLTGAMDRAHRRDPGALRAGGRMALRALVDPLRKPAGWKLGSAARLFLVAI